MEGPNRRYNRFVCIEILTVFQLQKAGRVQQTKKGNKKRKTVCVSVNLNVVNSQANFLILLFNFLGLRVPKQKYKKNKTNEFREIEKTWMV